jgi:hypothetical protein
MEDRSRSINKEGLEMIVKIKRPYTIEQLQNLVTEFHMTSIKRSSGIIW